MEWGLQAEKESLWNQNSSFEIVDKEGQIRFTMLGCTRENKTGHIGVAYRFIPLEHPACLTLTHLILVPIARRLETKKSWGNHTKMWKFFVEFWEVVRPTSNWMLFYAVCFVTLFSSVPKSSRWLLIQELVYQIMFFTFNLSFVNMLSCFLNYENAKRSQSRILSFLVCYKVV